jgi:hypothetical protein
VDSIYLTISLICICFNRDAPYDVIPEQLPVELVNQLATNAGLAKVEEVVSPTEAKVQKYRMQIAQVRLPIFC